MTVKPATRSRRAKAPRGGPRTARRSELKPVGHLYLQVASSLKQDIVSGVYPVGAQLPTEDELRARYSVSRHTVREALRRLRDDQLIASRQGAGTVVVPRPASSSYAQDVMSINDLVSWAASRRFAIESLEMQRLGGAEAARAGLTSGEQWLVVRGYGHMDGVECPVCWAEYYIHRDFAAVGRLLPRHTGPIFPLIEDLFGQSIVEVNQDITAVPLPATLAASLKVEAGSAALEVRRSYRTSDGKIAQVTISVHPASRYHHSMTLRRVAE
jgi:DNA-binding GntR family transcriptional regulator